MGTLGQTNLLLSVEFRASIIFLQQATRFYLKNVRLSWVYFWSSYYSHSFGILPTFLAPFILHISLLPWVAVSVCLMSTPQDSFEKFRLLRENNRKKYFLNLFFVHNIFAASWPQNHCLLAYGWVLVTVMFLQVRKLNRWR